MRNVPVNKLKVYPANAEGVKLPGDSYTAQINPTGYKVGHTASFGKDAAQGSSGAVMRFDRLLPEKLELTFLFDSTGSLGVDSLNPRGVQPEIDKFLDLAYRVNDEKLAPNYLIVHWAQLYYFCRLGSIDLSYSHFDFSGNPCRASAACTFVKEKMNPQREKDETDQGGSKSTVLKDGDKLDQIAKAQTGATAGLIAIAAANKLRSLRGPLSVPANRTLLIPGNSNS